MEYQVNLGQADMKRDGAMLLCQQTKRPEGISRRRACVRNKMSVNLMQINSEGGGKEKIYAYAVV